MAQVLINPANGATTSTRMLASINSESVYRYPRTSQRLHLKNRQFAGKQRRILPRDEFIKPQYTLRYEIVWIELIIAA
jgi:hypothetical protein